MTMTDERRWNVYACPGDCPDRSGLWNVAPKDEVCPSCGGRVVPVVVVPVSSVVPITRLHTMIGDVEEALDAKYAASAADAVEVGIVESVTAEFVDRLSALLDDVECASNPNNERTNT